MTASLRTNTPTRDGHDTERLSLSLSVPLRPPALRLPRLANAGALVDECRPSAACLAQVPSRAGSGFSPRPEPLRPPSTSPCTAPTSPILLPLPTMEGAQDPVAQAFLQKLEFSKVRQGSLSRQGSPPSLWRAREARRGPPPPPLRARARAKRARSHRLPRALAGRAGRPGDGGRPARALAHPPASRAPSQGRGRAAGRALVPGLRPARACELASLSPSPAPSPSAG